MSAWPCVAPQSNRPPRPSFTRPPILLYPRYLLLLQKMSSHDKKVHVRPLSPVPSAADKTLKHVHKKPRTATRPSSLEKTVEEKMEPKQPSSLLSPPPPPLFKRLEDWQPRPTKEEEERIIDELIDEDSQSEECFSPASSLLFKIRDAAYNLLGGNPCRLHFLTRKNILRSFLHIELENDRWYKYAFEYRKKSPTMDRYLAYLGMDIPCKDDADDEDFSLEPDKMFEKALDCFDFRSGEGNYNELKARKLVVKAMQLGSVIAKGKCYFHGWGGLKYDYKKAVQYYQEVIDQGNKNAYSLLAYCYEHGFGVKKDCEKADQLYQQTEIQAAKIPDKKLPATE